MPIPNSEFEGNRGIRKIFGDIKKPVNLPDSSQGTAELGDQQSGK